MRGLGPFVNNYANAGGGLYATDATVTGSSFVGNIAFSGDFEGDPRPFGGGFDIGFDQYALRLFLALRRR